MYCKNKIEREGEDGKERTRWSRVGPDKVEHKTRWSM